MKRILTILASLLALSVALKGQNLDSLALTLTPEYLDTVKVEDPHETNNYSMLGIAYGVDLPGISFNPGRDGTKMGFKPNYFSIYFTHHEKMFNYIPYFAFLAGLEYSHGGFQFKPKGDFLDGATSCSFKLADVVSMAQIHVDMKRTKIMAQVGGYVGYRFGETATGTPEPGRTNFPWEDAFRPIDYGLRGGAGFGIMFDPFELHIGALVRWSWSNLYDPTYYSTTYYRFAYPLDISIYAAFNFQLTKRRGRTTAELRKQAREIVYEKN